MDAALRTRLDALDDGLHRLVVADARRAVVKRRRAAPPGFFAMEAHGLALLRAAGELRVPAVYVVRGDALVMQDLGAGRFDAGRLPKPDLDALERLCADLPARIPAQAPALVHGDLWTANLHSCGDGELALIDAAAAHYGWPEADLAMLTLFGEPPARFFGAYQDEAAIGSSWRERAAVYNLYHLLNHLNLFGAGYLGAVRALLRHE